MKTFKTKLLSLVLLVGLSLHVHAQGVSAPINKFITTPTSEKAEIKADAADEISKHLALTAEYPEELRVLGIEGKSLVKITVDKKGTIVSKTIVKSLGRQFDHSIMKSLDKIKTVSPILVNGVAESYSIVVPIKYEK